MVRFGIIGTGKITEEFVMSALATGKACPAAVLSRKEETGLGYAERLGIANVFTELEAMLNSGKVDAVYIASPNALHAEQAIMCLSRGVAVLVEKPAASNACEFERVIRAAKQNSIALMEAVKSTLHPAFRVVMSQLPRLGTVRHFFASFCQYSSRYDAHLAGEYRNTYDPALSTGSLMDIGIYGVYPAVRLFGAPLSVQASGRLLSTGVDGSGSLILSYKDMDAVIMHAKNADSWLPSEIQGEKATLRIDRINLPQKIDIIYRDGTIATVFNETNSGASEALKMRKPFDISEIAKISKPFMSYEIEEFVGLLERREIESKINTWEASLKTLSVIEEARRQMGVRYPADTV